MFFSIASLSVDFKLLFSVKEYNCCFESVKSIIKLFNTKCMLYTCIHVYLYSRTKYAAKLAETLSYDHS